ncbi:uncharacterized protein F5Z01DRAFT_232305 [Emericellopsis atlantica]|uniref:Uncharacterized protein n=1 Tax=Emericellopsis atlantica TaxID=2614577 RepID=A0A9P7ZIU8_9HYPO|nr:uncharacterized protein F5Z01DRAFT_232305 [Emericellopsis atlantica]KAG9252512.1 hypothetical protein F5Z01DRAFT_232305 [Emericellopsis atlantica]
MDVPRVSYHVLLVGDRGVGTHELIKQFCTPSLGSWGPHDEAPMRTVDLGSTKASVRLSKLDWDNVSRETLAFQLSTCQCVVMSYSTSSDASFRSLLPRARGMKKAGMLDGHGLLVVGIQDFHGSRQVTPELGRQLAREVSAEFVEVATHDRHAIQALIVDFVRRLHAKRGTNLPRMSPGSNKEITQKPKLGLWAKVRRTLGMESRNPRGLLRKRPPPPAEEDSADGENPPRKRVNIGTRLEVDLGEELTGEDVFQGTLRRHR